MDKNKYNIIKHQISYKKRLEFMIMPRLKVIVTFYRLRNTIDYIENVLFQVALSKGNQITRKDSYIQNPYRFSVTF